MFVWAIAVVEENPVNLKSRLKDASWLDLATNT